MHGVEHHPRRAEGFIQANGQQLFAETFGNSGDAAVLLIMGNSAPGLVWPNAFCRQLSERGFFVIRFDQRDTGLSTYLDYRTSPYTLDDLVDDAFALLDGLGVRSAAIVGLSQGGVLAYQMALRDPKRLSAVTIMMSSADLRPKNDAFTGAPPRDGELPRPDASYVEKVIALNSGVAATEEDTARRFVENFRLASGPLAPFDEADWLAMGRAVAGLPRRRSDGLSARMANNSNHSLAQMATAPLSAADLSSLRLPVQLIHGSHDPIFPMQHAQWAAGLIAGAELVIIEGMGHALDAAFFESILQSMSEFWLRTRRVGAPAR
ncbi:alpha/beta fold hydrolase [Kaistia terrae]|uniref:Alpha/beta fold hydrolase n=1 Tax=Kaistia terrae TaxID=537017 RepID=A0ABW0Q2S4_9HYPH|nr:alpha/beta hydrolase [Kaistia terrae]MCX5581718.1 alpha/beta hydrolase [Kaistia terrae]